MQQDWQAFLISEGATIVNEQVNNFDTPLKETVLSNTSDICSDLSHYRLFRVSGADANSFLQGQLSNDINLVTENTTQMSSYCSPKGRAFALFRVFKIQDNYYLSLPAEVAEKTINRLKMFIMRSDVAIDDVSDDFFHIGIAGEKLSNILCDIFQLSQCPENADDCALSGVTSIQKLAGNRERFELFGPIEKAKNIWNQLNQHCTAVGQSAWNLQRINAGIPEILTNTSEAFVPQMLNLQLINAVNFQKGCYPGQEIVARTKYLGKLKKRLFLAEIHSAESVEIGTDIYESGENQQSVGKIVLSEPNSEETTRILAVLQITATEKQPLFVHQKDGEKLHLLELPYSLEE